MIDNFSRAKCLVVRKGEFAKHEACTQHFCLPGGPRVVFYGSPFHPPILNSATAPEFRRCLS
jgi:hypothetical protein